MIGNIGPIQLLIILVIVLLIFGTKRIRSLGSDLGGAIKEFRKGIGEDGSGDRSSDKPNKESTESSSSESSEAPADKSDDSSSTKH
ncbi:MAG TPA: twin-arginine translocase TatA/TatE family subunit [Wenzhouxiangella sp.]